MDSTIHPDTGRTPGRARLWLAALLLSASCMPTGGGASAPPGVTKIEDGGFSVAIGPVPDWVTPREAPAAWPGTPQDSPARTWLYDAQVDRRHGGRRSYLDLVVEPLNGTALPSLSQISLDYQPESETLTLHRVQVYRDGRWSDRLGKAQVTLGRRESRFEAQMFDGRVTALVVLSDVRLHDRVRLTYSVEGRNPVLSHYDRESFGVGYVDPILDYHVRVLGDREPGLAYRRNPGAPEPVTRTRADWVEISLDQHDLPAIREEGDTPNWFNVVPRLWIADRQEWSEIAQWAQSLYPAEQALDPELDTLVQRFKAEPTKEARALAALRWVQREIRYFGTELGENTHRPSAPSEVLARRYGDCKDKSRLLTALLRAMDLDANPALVSASNERGLADEPPSGGAFDHVIVELRLDGVAHWLDPTMELQGGDLASLTTGDFGFALPVRPGVSALVPVSRPDRQLAGYETEEHVRPAAQQDAAEVELVTTMRGQLAELVRRNLASEGSERTAQFLRASYEHRYSGVSETQPAAFTDDVSANVLRFTERYHVEHFWQSDGTAAYADIGARAIIDGLSFPKTVDRRSPLAVSYPMQLKHVTWIEVPKGRKPKLALDNVELRGGALEYSRSFSRDKDVLHIVHEASTRADHVAGAEIPTYLERLRRVLNAAQLRVVAEGPPLSRSERDQRLKRLLQGLTEDPNPGKADAEH